MKIFPKKVMTLNSANICVDESYQRKIKPNQIKRMTKSYNPNVTRKPRVSYRDGKYYVFDGQHTIVMLETINGGKPVMVECEVYFEMRQYDEKELFKLQDGVRSAPSAADNVRADFRLGEPYAVQMVRALESVGLEISFNGASGTNKIVCISTLLKSYNQLPLGRFVDMFNVIKTAWDGIPDSLCNQIIGGMTKFYKTYEKFDEKSLAEKLSKVTPISIVREAKGIGGGNTTIARIVLRIYNQNRTSKWRLEDKL